jgi:hypothetical protein
MRVILHNYTAQSLVGPDSIVINQPFFDNRSYLLQVGTPIGIQNLMLIFRSSYALHTRIA